MKTNLDYCIEVLEDCADYDTFTEEQRLHFDAWWKLAGFLRELRSIKNDTHMKRIVYCCECDRARKPDSDCYKRYETNPYWFCADGCDET